MKKNEQTISTAVAAVKETLKKQKADLDSSTEIDPVITPRSKDFVAEIVLPAILPSKRDLSFRQVNSQVMMDNSILNGPMGVVPPIALAIKANSETLEPTMVHSLTVMSLVTANKGELATLLSLLKDIVVRLREAGTFSCLSPELHSILEWVIAYEGVICVVLRAAKWFTNSTVDAIIDGIIASVNTLADMAEAIEEKKQAANATR
jgi:hypothetical protein